MKFVFCPQRVSISLPNQERMIEVDEMLNDDWKRKSTSSSPVVRSDSQSSLSQSGDKSQDATDKQKPVIPVHVIIKSRESSRSPGLPSSTTQRLTSVIPQLSPLSQPNEITSNMANASQQLRTIMSSINQATNNAPILATSNQSKLVVTSVESKSVDVVDTTNSATSTAVTATTKIENVTAKAPSFENVLSSSRTEQNLSKIETSSAEKPSTNIETGSIKVLKMSTVASSIENTSQSTQSQDGDQRQFGVRMSENTMANQPNQQVQHVEFRFPHSGTVTLRTDSQSSQQPVSRDNSITIASNSASSATPGSILVVKQLRAVSPMSGRSRSPVSVNSTGSKSQTISVVKSSVSGTPAVIISGQQQSQSVIIAQSKLPILTKIATEASTNTTTSTTTTVSSSATETQDRAYSNQRLISRQSATSNSSATISISSSTTSISPSMSILGTTLSQPQQSRISHFTLKKPPALIMSQMGTTSQAPSLVSTSSSMSVTNSTAAIQNILQSSLQSQPLSGSILGATLSQPSKSNKLLLQSQLNSSNNPFRRSKSTDEVIGSVKETPAQIIGKRHSSMESSSIVKEEKLNMFDETVSSTGQKDTEGENCKYSTISIVPHTKTEDSQNSQNVLLKQLLQNSGNSNAPSPSPISSIASRSVTSLRAPSLGLVSSLEAQLARPVIPPPNAIQPKPTAICVSPQPLQSNSEATVPAADSNKNTSIRPHLILSRETSFISKPITVEKKEEKPTTVTLVQTPATIATTLTPTVTTSATSKPIQSESCHDTQPNITSKMIVTPAPLPEVIVKTEPSTPEPTHSTVAPTIASKTFEANNMSLTIQTTIKKEDPMSTQTSPPQESSPVPISQPLSIQSMDVKRELLDDNSQMSAASDHSSVKQEPIKEEFIGNEIANDPETAAKVAQETALEIKRRKRREYQKNRRQMQTQSKESGNTSTSTKKKAKKFSAVTKVDEDYDTFIDNLMVQLKLMPPMQILEPVLSRNYCVCPVYGSGDLNKFGVERDYSIISGDLNGEYGNAELPTVSDHYNTKPFGCKSPLSEQHNSSTHYGFYDQEFSPIKFSSEDENRNKYDFLKERDIETPDTIISSSSPECVVRESPLNFPGLRLIQEDDDEEDAMESHLYKRMSPQIPIIAPIPIRLKKGISLTANNNNPLSDQSNLKDIFGNKSRFGPPLPSKDKNNVTITLTLTSSAADDIMTVLQDLANILHIPAPTCYQIVERTTTPPSQKLGLYRTRGKDGKEGAPIDIQTILNGNAKFCRHCDVVILNTVIRAKAYEFPLLNNNNELVSEADDLYFCSKSCYKQFQCVPTNILEDKAFEMSSTDENSTYDDTVKYSKNPNILLTTASSTGDINDHGADDENAQDDDLKMEVNFKDTEFGNLMDDVDIKSESNADAGNKVTDKAVRKLSLDSEQDRPPAAKKLKGMQYMKYSSSCFRSPMKYKKMTEKEITEMLFRMNITVTPSPKVPDDTRQCIFCHQIGDGVADGPSRLLNFDVDKWVHLNCALWSDGVYETVNGALMNLENALQVSFVQQCTLCNQLGATIKCFKNRCANVYHLNCAIKDDCVFYKSKTTHCAMHASKTEKDNELTTLSVQRRVYVERDEARQVASVMHHSELSNLLRVGSLIFLNVGQLLPHQLQNFHTPNFIYPIGYKIIRFYWSMRRPNKRCRYVCSIADVAGRPEFRVVVQEPFEEDIELRDLTPKAIWQRILERLAQLRKEHNLVQIFPKFIIGEDLFGLTEPAVVRILESLPGIETLTDYRFKYGRNPLLELPLAINPSGAARTEPKPQQNLSWKKPHTQRSGSASQRPAFVASTSVAGEVACPYSKQFVHSKSSQYKKMKQEWRNNVFLAR